MTSKIDQTPWPPGLSDTQQAELDQILSEMNERAEEIPQWDFCDGALTALVCTRRPVPVEEFLPVLLGDGEPMLRHADGSLPVLPAFADAAQQQRFLQLWQIRWDEVQAQLDAPDVEHLHDARAFAPLVLDMRGAIAALSDAERQELQLEEIPSFGQLWALGFMFVVENWAEEWSAPRDKQAASWLNEALDSIVALTEDDTDPPTVCMHDDDGPPSTSQDRLERLGQAIWAVYDLRELWRTLGPRQPSIVKGERPGRNDPCPCGSGQKYKKCHG